MRTVRVFQAISIALLLAGLSGCAGFAARCTAYAQCKADERAHRQKLLAEQLEALKEDLEAERQAIAAERELEIARERAECEKRTCVARNQYDESVRTKLGLDLDQRVKVGQMQVNLPELQRLMAEREQDYAERMRAFNEAKNQQKQAETEAYKSSLMGPCCQCSEPSCAAPGPNCEAPGHICSCQRCGLPMQQNQNAADCAGTRPFREGPQKPVQEPLLATQLPMMLPVRLEVGVTNSYVNDSRVRRQPYMAPASAAQAQHDMQAPCGVCRACRSGRPCQRCAPPPASCDAPHASLPSRLGTIARWNEESQYAPEPAEGLNPIAPETLEDAPPQAAPPAPESRPRPVGKEPAPINGVHKSRKPWGHASATRLAKFEESADASESTGRQRLKRSAAE
ncbi:MAG: hypothetical protein ACKV0T_04885 [Planctomycetales bacterium]